MSYGWATVFTLAAWFAGLVIDANVRVGDLGCLLYTSAKGKTYNATVLLSCEADGRSKFSLEFESGC